MTRTPTVSARRRDGTLADAVPAALPTTALLIRASGDATKRDATSESPLAEPIILDRAGNRGAPSTGSETTLVLATTGRRTGTPRRPCLICRTSGGEYVVRGTGGRYRPRCPPRGSTSWSRTPQLDDGAQLWRTPQSRLSGQSLREDRYSLVPRPFRVDRFLVNAENPDGHGRGVQHPTSTS